MCNPICVMENDDEVIHPCPFCHVGGATLAVYKQGVRRYVACANCGAQGPHAPTNERAVEGYWNSVSDGEMWLAGLREP